MAISLGLRALGETYVIWSHEHAAWWGPGGAGGYVTRLAEAGRFTRAVALKICAAALPGTDPDGVPNELPIRLTDLYAVASLASTGPNAIDPEDTGAT